MLRHSVAGSIPVAQESSHDCRPGFARLPTIATMNTIPITRRRFLGAGSAALGLAPAAHLRARTHSPIDEIAIGIIGCGAMGMGNMTTFLNLPGVRVVAVNDVDANRMNEAKAKVDGHYQNTDCKVYADHSDLLHHRGLDAVSLATPDHWHAKIGIDAANARLDIYGEKPFTWGLREGRLLMDALRKNKRVWQTGSWQRSSGEFRRLKALIDNPQLARHPRLGARVTA